MLGNEYWDFKTIEKITSAVGYIFSDIQLQRVDPNTSAVKIIKVPLSLSSKEKWAVRDLEDPNAGDEARQRHVQIVLPRMAYEFTNFHYDSKRKLPSVNYRVAPSGNGPSALIQLNPIPFIFDYSVYLQTRNLSDAYAIVAQVATFFRPDYVIPIIDIPEMNIARDLVVTLSNSSHSDSYEGNMYDKRVIEWQFDLNVQAFLYPPIKEKKVITQADIICDNGETIQVAANPNTGNIDQPYDIVETIII